MRGAAGRPAPGTRACPHSCIGPVFIAKSPSVGNMGNMGKAASGKKCFLQPSLQGIRVVRAGQPGAILFTAANAGLSELHLLGCQQYSHLPLPKELQNTQSRRGKNLLLWCVTILSSLKKHLGQKADYF